MRRFVWVSALVCLVTTTACAHAQPRHIGPGLPYPIPPKSSPSARSKAELALLANTWAPDVYQDTDDSNAVADLLTDIDFDGDSVMTNNWENLEGQSFEKVLGEGSVYWWGSSSATHHYIGYSFFHPRDWADHQGPLDRFRPFVREKLGLGNDEHENDMEGILLVISKATGKPELMLTQAHGHFWQYGSSDDWGDGLDDLDGPIRFDPKTGRPMVFVEAKGHGVYGSPKKTHFEPGKGDGVVYTQEPSGQGGWEGAEVTGYRLRDLEPWWKRYQQLPDGASDETYTREGEFAAFRGATHGSDKANPPWGWSDKDYSPAVSRLFFANPARYVERVLQPKNPFSARIRERSFPLTYSPPRRRFGPRPFERARQTYRGIRGAFAR